MDRSVATARHPDSSSPPAPSSGMLKKATEELTELKKLLGQFADIVAAQDEHCTCTDLVQHEFNTDGAQPVHLIIRPRRLPFAKRATAEVKVKEMLQAGIEDIDSVKLQQEQNDLSRV